MATATETVPAGTIELPVRTNDHLNPKTTVGEASCNDSASNEPPRQPKRIYLQFVSVGFSFFVAGVNDGSTGALLPYVIREYHINTAIVSSVYVNIFFWIQPINSTDMAPTLLAGSPQPSPTLT